MSHKLRIDDVVKSYGRFNAVDHVSLEIGQGEFFTLLGPSGCGKTTLLRMIAGFNTIDEGKIYFDDTPINGVSASKRNIGMVFQNYAVFPHLTVRENVAYGLKARKVRGQELTDRTDEAMRLMQIYEYRDRMPAQLSGGQQQRVALARAIVITPGFLLMDEPLSNLDAKLRVEMRGSIRTLQKQLGITTIYVTHDQEEALAISDRIAVMRSGRVMQLGRPEEIYMHPANQFVAGFIGTSSFLEGVASGGDVVLENSYTLSGVLSAGYSGPATVSVRPEHVVLTVPSADSLSGKIQESTFLGDFIHYTVALTDGTLIQANEYSDKMRHVWQDGEAVGVKLPVESVTVFEGSRERLE